jgi:hypothetical protein
MTRTQTDRAAEQYGSWPRSVVHALIAYAAHLAMWFLAFRFAGTWQLKAALIVILLVYTAYVLYLQTDDVPWATLHALLIGGSALLLVCALIAFVRWHAGSALQHHVGPWFPY